MFEAFYEMSSTPFTRSIPSHELYMPPELDEVENRLKYVAKRQLHEEIEIMKPCMGSSRYVSAMNAI